MERIIFNKIDYDRYKAIISYCIYGEKESKIVVSNILKKIDLKEDNFSMNQIDSYIDKLQSYAEKIICRSNPALIMKYCENLRELYSIRDFPTERLQYMISLDEAACWISSLAIKYLEQMPYPMQEDDMKYLYEIFRMSDEMIKKKEYQYINSSYSYDLENAFTPIEDDNLDNFLEDTNSLYGLRGIEEESVINEKLYSKLEKRKLLPKLIYEKNNQNLLSLMGFTYSDIDVLINDFKEKLINRHGDRCIYNQNHVRIAKGRLFAIFKKKINEANFKKIIEFLSIKPYSKGQRNDLVRELEIKCIYEYENELCFGYNTFIKSLWLIKVLSICGHFPEVFGFTNKQNQVFVDAQSDFSTFFSYYIADFLSQKGYILPIKNDCIEVEIKNITLSSGEKLHFNDIDVLALNEKKKILYNLELKYFKGKVYYRAVFTDSLETKKLNSFLERQKILQANLADILLEKFGIVDSRGYIVKPVYITARPNNNTKEIEEYDYNTFKQLIEEGDL